MVLVDKLTPDSVIETAINKAYKHVDEQSRRDRTVSTDALREATLFLYTELKPGVSYKGLFKRFVEHYGKEIHEYAKAIRILLMRLSNTTPGINLRLETRSFVYEPGNGYVKLKALREEIKSCFLGRDFISSGELKEEQIRSYFILEVMGLNEWTLENKFKNSVVSEIKGMFGIGEEGTICKRLNVVAGHLQAPNYLKALADKNPICFLPMGIVKELVKPQPSFPETFKESLDLYKSLGYINSGTIEELHSGIAMAVKRDFLVLPEDSEWIIA